MAPHQSPQGRDSNPDTNGFESQVFHEVAFESCWGNDKGVVGDKQEEASFVSVERVRRASRQSTAGWGVYLLGQVSPTSSGFVDLDTSTVVPHAHETTIAVGDKTLQTEQTENASITRHTPRHTPNTLPDTHNTQPRGEHQPVASTDTQHAIDWGNHSFSAIRIFDRENNSTAGPDLYDEVLQIIEQIGLVDVSQDEIRKRQQCGSTHVCIDNVTRNTCTPHHATDDLLSQISFVAEPGNNSSSLSPVAETGTTPAGSTSPTDTQLPKGKGGNMPFHPSYAGSRPTQDTLNGSSFDPSEWDVITSQTIHEETDLSEPPVTQHKSKALRRKLSVEQPNDGPKFHERFSSVEIWWSDNALLYTVYGIITLLNTVMFFWGALFFVKVGMDGQLPSTLMACLLPVAKGAGRIITFDSALLLLTACKACIGRLQRTPLNHVFPFDHVMPRIHRHLAIWIAVCSVIHTIPHCVFLATKNVSFRSGFLFWREQLNLENMPATMLFVTGILLLLVIFMMVISASEFVRRRNHRAFWIIHVAGIVTVYALLAMHGLHRSALFTIWFLAGPMALYFFDRVLRMTHHTRKPYVVYCKALPGGITKLVLSRPPGFKHRAGQYVEIRCTGISMAEWHPFTIASTPLDSHLVFYIKAEKNWTWDLHRRAKSCLDDTWYLGQVHIRGPYGAPAQHVGDFEDVLLIGSGVGMTPFCSIYNSLAAGACRKTRNNTFMSRASSYLYTKFGHTSPPLLSGKETEKRTLEMKTSSVQAILDRAAVEIQHSTEQPLRKKLVEENTVSSDPHHVINVNGVESFEDDVTPMSAAAAARLAAEKEEWSRTRRYRDYCHYSDMRHYDQGGLWRVERACMWVAYLQSLTVHMVGLLWQSTMFCVVFLGLFLAQFTYHLTAYVPDDAFLIGIGIFLLAVNSIETVILLTRWTFTYYVYGRPYATSRCGILDFASLLPRIANLGLWAQAVYSALAERQDTTMGHMEEAAHEAAEVSYYAMAAGISEGVQMLLLITRMFFYSSVLSAPEKISFHGGADTSNKDPYAHDKTVQIVWCSQTAQQLLWFVDDVSERDARPMENVHIDFYVTRQKKRPTRHEEGAGQLNDASIQNSKFHFGNRPQWEDILKTRLADFTSRTETKTLGVFVCGGKSLQDGVKDAARKVQRAHRLAGGQCRIVVRCENF